MYVCFCLLQVVKRAGAVLESAYTDPIPSVGAKRSVHDRLGTNVELNSKRCLFHSIFYFYVYVMLSYVICLCSDLYGGL